MYSCMSQCSRLKTGGKGPPGGLNRPPLYVHSFNPTFWNRPFWCSCGRVGGIVGVLSCFYTAHRWRSVPREKGWEPQLWILEPWRQDQRYYCKVWFMLLRQCDAVATPPTHNPTGTNTSKKSWLHVASARSDATSRTVIGLYPSFRVESLFRGTEEDMWRRSLSN